MDDLINTVIQGDCLDIMRGMPDNCIDLVLTDPPYGINYDGETTCYGKSGKGNTFNKGIQHHKKLGWDSETPGKEYFEEMMRISKNQIIFGGNYFTDKLPVSRGWLYWDKKIINKNNKTHSDGELCWSSFNKILKKYVYDWIGFGYLNSPEARKQHPTQKPVNLITMILEDYSEPGMTIFDPFAGSGTTGIACLETGRNYILVEKEPEYIDIINNRINQWKEQGRLFPVG